MENTQHNLTDEEIELFDAYILNRMTAKEKQKLEKRMQEDDVFADKARFFFSLKEAVKQKAEERFSAKLNRAVKSEKKKATQKRIIVYSLAALLVIFLGFTTYFFLYKKTSLENLVTRVYAPANKTDVYLPERQKTIKALLTKAGTVKTKPLREAPGTEFIAPLSREGREISVSIYKSSEIQGRRYIFFRDSLKLFNADIDHIPQLYLQQKHDSTWVYIQIKDSIFPVRQSKKLQKLTIEMF